MSTKATRTNAAAATLASLMTTLSQGKGSPDAIAPPRTVAILSSSLPEPRLKRSYRRLGNGDACSTVPALAPTAPTPVAVVRMHRGVAVAHGKRWSALADCRAVRQGGRFESEGDRRASVAECCRAAARKQWARLFVVGQGWDTGCPRMRRVRYQRGKQCSSLGLQASAARASAHKDSYDRE